MIAFVCLSAVRGDRTRSVRDLSIHKTWACVVGAQECKKKLTIFIFLSNMLESSRVIFFFFFFSFFFLAVQL